MKTLSILVLAITIIPIQKSMAQHQPVKKTVTAHFGHDRDFLLKHDAEAVILGKGHAQLIVSPKYQAKVFTSTAEGTKGKSFGWINYKAFEEPLNPHMNGYGGENRFWLGPEGGKYSLFFKGGSTMSFENWKTPAAYDSEAWQLVSKNETTAVMEKDMMLENYQGSHFTIHVNRKVSLLNNKSAGQLLATNIPKGVKAVAYRTENIVTNTGDKAWDESTGMPCTWILDMFPPSDKTTIIVPYKPGPSKPATTDYFGEIPTNRIKMDGKTLFFKADGKQRGKIGIHPKRAEQVAGSYDLTNHILTIILFDVSPMGKYLNQEWRTDKPVFSGDAMNIYNDGPLDNGQQMGPFYELESVSTAHFLAPKQSSTHWHSVFHFVGNEVGLNYLAKKILKVSLSKINQAF